MRARGVTFGAWALVLTLACSPPKPVLPAPIAVHGVLVEFHSGQPIAGQQLKLGAFCWDCPSSSDVARIVTTGADGSFRFEGVPLGSNRQGSYALYYLKDKTSDPKDDHSWLNLTGAKQKISWATSGEFELYLETPPTGDEKKPAFRVTGPAVDVGPIQHNDHDLAAQAFAPVCETGQPKGLLPATGLAVLHKSEGEWSYDWLLQEQLTEKWKPAWPAFLCIRISHQQVGRYDDAERTPALRTTWRVNVINAQNGEQIKTTVDAAPPLYTQVQSYQGTDITQRSGDPTPELLSWIEERLAKAPAAAAVAEK
jgi:hypothetical protein